MTERSGENRSIVGRQAPIVAVLFLGHSRPQSGLLFFFSFFPFPSHSRTIYSSNIITISAATAEMGWTAAETLVRISMGLLDALNDVDERAVSNLPSILRF